MACQSVEKKLIFTYHQTIHAKTYMTASSQNSPSNAENSHLTVSKMQNA